MPRISRQVHANLLNYVNQRERCSAFSRLIRMMFCMEVYALKIVHAF